MGQNIGEFSHLDYLEEKTLANGLHINTDVKYSGEKTSVIGRQFTNVFFCQHFLLYSIFSSECSIAFL